MTVSARARMRLRHDDTSPRLKNAVARQRHYRARRCTPTRGVAGWLSYSRNAATKNAYQAVFHAARPGSVTFAASGHGGSIRWDPTNGQEPGLLRLNQLASHQMWLSPHFRLGFFLDHTAPSWAATIRGGCIHGAKGLGFVVAFTAPKRWR